MRESVSGLLARGLLLVTCIGYTADATDLVRKSELQLAREAELILDGTVVQVAYRSSEPTGKEGRPVPHTFVTFEVHHVLKGVAPKDGSITLRFVGGPYEESQRILAVPGVPLFDVGERSILFVRGNTRRICPLVGWEQGRFRVVDGRVYTDGGREVLLSSTGNLIQGAYRPLEEVVTNVISSMQVERRRATVEGEGRVELRGEPARPIAHEEFLGHVRQLVKRGGLTPPRPVATADIRMSFTFQLEEAPPPRAEGEERR